MTNPTPPDIRQSWRILLMEEEALRHYPHVFLLHGTGTHRDSLLDSRLSSLLYIKAVAILDDGLEEAIVHHGLPLPAEASLYRRIEALDQQGLVNATDLHRIRQRRNDLAHEVGNHADWQELAADRTVMQACLEALGVIADLPTKVEFYSERSAIRESTREGYSYERDFEYGVKTNDTVGLQVTWTEYLG